MCAAVADYTPKEVATHKLKKDDNDLHIALRRTKDIAAELGQTKGNRLLIGFALESHDGEQHARKKLHDKGLDFIVLNSLQDKGAGFGVDTNKVTFIDSEGKEELPLMSKSEVAARIADKMEECFEKR